MVSWSTWLNAFVPTGSIYFTHWYSAKRRKLGYSLLRSIEVTGLCVHMTSISALKFTVVVGPQYVQGTLEDFRSTLQTVFSGQHPSVTSALVPLVGEPLWMHQEHTPETPGMDARNITKRPPVHLYTKTLMYMWHKKTKKKLWRAGKFLQGVLANCCIHTELQWFGFSQQLLV